MPSQILEKIHQTFVVLPKSDQRALPLLVAFPRAFVLDHGLQLSRELVLQQLLGQSADYHLERGEVVLVHVDQAVLYLAKLQVSGSDKLRRAGEVVSRGHRQDLEYHHDTHLSLGLFLLDGFFELADGVLVLVGELPPVGAALAHLHELRLPQVFLEAREGYLDLDKVFKVKLKVLGFKVKGKGTLLEIADLFYFWNLVVCSVKWLLVVIIITQTLGSRAYPVH